MRRSWVVLMCTSSVQSNKPRWCSQWMLQAVPLIFWLGIVHVIVARLNWDAWDAWSNAPQLTSCNYFVGQWLPFHHWPTLWSPIYTHPTAGSVPIKTLVAKQRPTDNCVLHGQTPTWTCHWAIVSSIFVAINPQHVQSTLQRVMVVCWWLLSVTS